MQHSFDSFVCNNFCCNLEKKMRKKRGNICTSQLARVFDIVNAISPRGIVEVFFTHVVGSGDYMP